MASFPALSQAVKESIRHWSDLAELARFAVEPHGFGNSDTGFRITYAEDLDDYDRAQGAAAIPAGHVLAYGCWGAENAGYEVLVPESVYLNALAEALESAGLRADADI